MPSRTMLVVATAGSLCNAYSLQPLHPQPLMQRAASPVMQFGFQNYDRKTEAPKRNSNPLNYLNPIPGGSNVRSSHILPITAHIKNLF